MKHLLVILNSINVSHYRAEGYTDLADRLLELQYELTDRLAYYVCKRKPGKFVRIDVNSQTDRQTGILCVVKNIQ